MTYRSIISLILFITSLISQKKKIKIIKFNRFIFYFLPGFTFFRGGAPHLNALLSTVSLGLLY